MFTYVPILYYSTKSKNHYSRCNIENCKAKLTSQKFLERHILTVHKKAEEKAANDKIDETQMRSHHICHTCGRKFLHHRSITEHLRNAHAKFDCDTCGLTLYGHLSLLKHQRENHIAPAICDVCGQNFKHKKYLRDHIVRYVVKNQNG